MAVVPYQNKNAGKKDQVRDMFNNISHRYDFLNRVLSFGIDIYWRRRAIRELKRDHPKQILDMATGTGDFAIACLTANPDRVVGVDLSPGMLSYGHKKMEAKGLTDKIQLLEGDAEKILFPDATFDAITVAFGVRNFENLLQGLQEMNRVLKPGGKLIVLEFSQPKPWFAAFYNLYFKHILPRIGKIFSKDFAAYNYLYESVQAFPAGDAFLQVMDQASFKERKQIPLTFGVCSIYIGKK
jgi:demethylmenaquinone methyltransferase/2-methoxy-6-polyprenyl-1,4-benzoquinol methylase